MQSGEEVGQWTGCVRHPVVIRLIRGSRSTLLAMLGLSFAIATLPASAEQAAESVYGRDGVYMGGRGVYGYSWFAAKKPPANADVENGWGFGLNVGYRFMKFFATEIDLEVMDPGYKVDGTTLRNLGMTLFGKAYPLAFLPPRGNWLDRIQPYAKAGIGFQYFFTKSNEFSETGFVARFGGGTEFYLTKQLALTVDGNYIVTTGPISGRNAWSVGVIGLLWRFSPS